ncbi:MAG: NUDIX domain-containing protein [Candidatus Devosia phytovorans]|uniref:NUDIX domain-containing protein n=1 Tax=Candidatus Devosia phytovorans TaxID=3121372 RepID=A0AAJ6B080_9HYPH|nr:NUDIX domain-containing protein [Devosia sp.]WEK04942.1 MAG: NUDIX domain-containing protein [Devosia sp.]
MPSQSEFPTYLDQIVSRYLRENAGPGEYLPLLQWQIAEGHRLDERTTYPGHLTTSAIVLSPDHAQVLLIDHVTIGRWLQPGGHYELSDRFWQSAEREAVEETAVTGLMLHPWHQDEDRPFVIDSHDVPGKQARNEQPHVHHDLQYLFIADPGLPLAHQAEEVHAARWAPLVELEPIAPKVMARLRDMD